MDENFIVTARQSEEKRRLAVQMRREMTLSEQVLWQRLRANCLNGLHFRRQQIIDGFIADFFCHAAKLVIELDGRIHTDQQEYDAERDRIIAGHGLSILRFTNDEIKANLNGVLQQISVAARERLK
ncbi:MAG: DUF559 domain-containing protein [Armatimonadota bacterium]|nr:DUF559 domain-containing protein [Armatimonadota bacterium]